MYLINYQFMHWWLLDTIAMRWRSCRIWTVVNIFWVNNLLHDARSQSVVWTVVFCLFFFQSTIYYTGRVGRPWQYKKKGDYGPSGHVVNPLTTLTKHEAKKYSYERNEWRKGKEPSFQHVLASQTLLPTPKHVPHCHRPSWIPRLITDTHPGAPVKPHF